MFGGIKKSIDKHGIVRWLLALPILCIYTVSYSLLSPQYKTPFQLRYEKLFGKMAEEKIGITTPVTLSPDLFYYSSLWQDVSGESPFAPVLMTESLEYLFKCMNFLKDIHDNDETILRQMIHDRMISRGPGKNGSRTEQEIYESVIAKGEYFSRLFDQLFSQHGLKKLGAKYSDTDVEVFFNMLCANPEEKKFRLLFGALILNVPYYLVIKNSVSEYYQNNDVLIPVDLFSFTLFMMYLEQVKKSNNRPTIEECRRWVFSVIVPDEKRNELQSRKFTVQPINREEMIMPNPGYFSKRYNEKKHKAIDIASERGTMIRSPVTGTVTYYEQSRKKAITGNFIIIKDESSPFNIFICHMDNKDYIEEHSTEGELAEPIASLTPDWVHPLKKGQFFQVVGNTGKSTGAHTHIQVVRRTWPYATYNFFAVNIPYQEQFYGYLYKNGWWNVYSRNEQLLLSVFGMVVSRYDSTRHFADRDPATLEMYKQLQMYYTPVSETIDSSNIAIEEITDKILKTYFPGTIQERVINERYGGRLKYYAGFAVYFNYLLRLQVPQAALPQRAIPLTPWMVYSRRRDDEDADEAATAKSRRDRIFYHAANKFFLYRIMQVNNTPRHIREHLLSDPVFTGITLHDVPAELPLYEAGRIEERISALAKIVREVTASTVNVSFILEDDFCEMIFNDITAACKREGVPLDSNFGFFRYRMSELQNSYQASRFISFPETREFRYDRKYDPAIRSFFLDIFEMAAEYKNYELFRRLYFTREELAVSLFRRIQRKIKVDYKRAVAWTGHRLFHKPFPESPEIFPVHLHSLFQEIISDIIRPVSFESRTYAEGTYCRAAESALFYSLVYEVYLSEREHYMKLFPAGQLSSVVDAIGLFDSMFKLFCDNAAQKQLIDGEHARITRELESMEKELNSLKDTKRELQEDFRNKTASLRIPGDYTTRHSELFSTYVTEEEKISRTIAYLEQSLERYRDECSSLKKEKEQLQAHYEESVGKMNREIEELRSRNILEQQRFRSEMKRIAYDKGKSDLEIVDLKTEIDHLKNKIENMNVQYNKIFKTSGEASLDHAMLQKKYEKILSDFNSLQKKYDELVNALRAAIGPYSENLSTDKLAAEVERMLKSSDVYRDAGARINLLQDQLKNDRRSLMLNANLITRLKERVEKLEVELQYLHDTTASDREKELEEENRRLSDIIKKSGL